MSSTTKTLEHFVPAYNLPRGEVAEAAQVAEAVEAVLVLAAMVVAAAGSELAHNCFSLTPPNGWRGRPVCGVLNAETVPPAICQTLLKAGVDALLRPIPRRL
jgi:hypothetical protein